MNQQEAAISSRAARQSVGQAIREQRLKRGLSQEALAEAIGVSARSIRRWELDQAIPHEVARHRLCAVFGVEKGALFGAWSSEHASSIPLALWHVPLSRNPFFTGREELLHTLHQRLTSEQNMALTQSWAISGLGGIGKTQIALEYAYQHAQEYSAVFWISAATQESLQADLVTVAERLKLPGKDEHDHTRIVRAVKQWLATHQNWLLILDNADDVAIIRDVLPAQRSGHLLLTTRAQALGPIAQRMDVETMGMAEGTLFLLRRARLLAPDALLDQAPPRHLVDAEAIVIEMDFLPLALDQAGAYIEEVGCSLSSYLDLYRTHRAELLQRRGHMPEDYPESVATTWSLNFQQVGQANPAAAELLRLCAFLSPDAIPEELFSEGGTVLGPVLEQVATDALALNKAIEELRKFSLIQRDPEARLLRIHRLVQAVLQDALKREDQRMWAERAVHATNLVFPEIVEPANWPRCRRFLPQAQACSALIRDAALVFIEAASLLSRTSDYLYEAGLYEQAQQLYQQTLGIREQALGPDHPQVAEALRELTKVYAAQGKHKQAEPLSLRALRICEQAYGPHHRLAADAMTGLAHIYVGQGKFAQAGPLYQQALRIGEQEWGAEHPEVVYALNGLARVSIELGKYAQAEPLYLRALSIRERVLGPDHPQVSFVLSRLAILYREQGRYDQAEPLYQRVVRIEEQAWGPDHPGVTDALYGLARIYGAQGKFEQAEQLYQRVLRIREQALGPDHPQIAFVLGRLGDLYREQGKLEQAERLCQRALRIRELVQGPEHPEVAYELATLARVYKEQEKFEQAAALYQQALRLSEQGRGREHRQVADVLHGLANLSYKRGMDQQAASLFQQTLSIQERILGEYHLETAETLHDFAAFQQTRSNCQEAAELYSRALAIREQILGVDHPTTVTTRIAYAALVQGMNQEE